ncbi:unnamed protein product, partial [Sphenostylis stenocarpa]
MINGSLTKLQNVIKDESTGDFNTWRTKFENGSLMKDISLDHISDNPSSKSSSRENNETDDQMLELWETAKQDCYHSLM